MKRIISIILTAAIMMLGVVPAMAADTGEPSAWAREDVQNAIARGLVPIRLQSNYQAPITREEFAELLVTAVFKEFNNKCSGVDLYTRISWEFDTLTIDNFLSKVSTTNVFEDTDSKYVKVANILGMVNGVSEFKFNPNSLITREQAAIMFVNYFQTVCGGSTYWASEELSDLEEASPWAKEAVIRAYGAGYLKGTKPIVYDDNYDKIIEKGYFDTKGNLTREQAIIVIYRLGIKGILNNLILRGYVVISMDQLMFGFEVDGDTVKMLRSDYDNPYSEHRMNWSAMMPMVKYYPEVTCAQAEAHAINAYGAIMAEEASVIAIIKNETTEFEYKVFNVKHNFNGYLVVVNKKPNMGYMDFSSALRYGDKNQYTVEGVRIK